MGKHQEQKGKGRRRRELAIAVKQGGPNPDSNSRLRDVIAKAKAANMPNDNISRSIKKASGELNAVNYEKITYEGYAAGGVAVIVETLTDNKNRTASDVRCAFDKFGGNLGSTGCVSYMFSKKGVIVVDGENVAEDDLFLLAVDAGADDVQTDDGVYEIYTLPQNYTSVRENIEKQGLKILSSGIEMVPENYVTPEESAIPKILNLIDRLEENDDVQNVFHNAVLPEEEEED